MSLIPSNRVPSSPRQTARRALRPSRFINGTLLAASLFAAALPLASTEASATVVVIHPLDEMAHRADVIVHAVVRDQEVKREDGRIITLTQIEVLEGIKGAKAGDIQTIFQVGGKLDGEVVTVVGNSRFTVGEEMVYFAMSHRDRLVSYGVGVGKFVVDRNSGAVTIREEFGDVIAVDPSQPRAGTHKPEPRNVASLAALASKIRHDPDQPAPAQINRPRLKTHQKQLLNPRAKVLRRLGDAPAASTSHDHQ